MRLYALLPEYYNREYPIPLYYTNVALKRGLDLCNIIHVLWEANAILHVFKLEHPTEHKCYKGEVPS